MRNLLLIAIALMAAVLAAAPVMAQTGPVYIRSNAGLPWNVSSNEGAMTMVFGEGNWYDARYETVDTGWLFSANVPFIFMEGGDSSASAMTSFLSTNSDALNTWVSNGGRLFINAAPNSGNNIACGFGVTLNYSSSYSTAGASGYAPNPTHTVFGGPFRPVGNSFPANYFSHAYLSGAGLSAVLNDDSDRPVLAEKRIGHGLVMIGGMTVDVFQDPQPNTHNLRANIISYTSTTALQ